MDANQQWSLRGELPNMARYDWGRCAPSGLIHIDSQELTCGSDASERFPCSVGSPIKAVLQLSTSRQRDSSPSPTLRPDRREQQADPDSNGDFHEPVRSDETHARRSRHQRHDRECDSCIPISDSLNPKQRTDKSDEKDGYPKGPDVFRKVQSSRCSKNRSNGCTGQTLHRNRTEVPSVGCMTIIVEIDAQ